MPSSTVAKLIHTVTIQGLKQTGAAKNKSPGLPSGRTKEGRRLRDFRAALIHHIGGQPSVPQLALIDRAVMLQGHVSRMDMKAAQSGGMSEGASREYLAWSNSLTRTMVALGLEGAPKPTDSRPAWERIMGSEAAD